MAGTLVVLTFLANRGPVVDLLRSRAAWAEQAQALAAAQADVEAAKAELDSLSAPSRLEVRARQDLGYVRPGEEMFVVEGNGDVTSAATAAGQSTEHGSGADGNASADDRDASSDGDASASDRESTTGAEPGLLERLVLRIRQAFE